MCSELPPRVFVYGTLKTGQCRERCWPHDPIEIVSAMVYGELYDLGDYPAMLPGADRVSGELWIFQPEHLAATLAVLDEIEDFRQRPDDLYRRVRIPTWVEENTLPVTALTYLYWQPHHLRESQRIQPASSGDACSWPRA